MFKMTLNSYFLRFNLLKFIWIILFILPSACKRAGETDSGSKSKISIYIPENFSSNYSKNISSQSVGTLAVVDYSKMCLWAHVYGAGVAVEPGLSNCDWRKGLVSTVATPGSTITLDVPKGSNRTIDIVGYLRNSSSDSCPALPTQMQSGFLAKSYLLGQKTAVELNLDLVNITIDLSLPQDTNTIVSQMNLPACLGGSNNGGNLTSNSYKIINGSLAGHTSMVGTSASYKIRGQVLGKQQTGPLTSTNYKLVE